MKLNKETRFRCDFCRGMGEYSIKTQLEFNDLIICGDCLKDLYSEMGRLIVPKSPENIILKKEKKRKEDAVTAAGSINNEKN